MEETRKQPQNLEAELKNLSNIESRIEQTKKQLSQLLKLDNHHSKDLQHIMKQTFMTTRNKVNHLQSVQKLSSKQTHDNDELIKKKNMIRERKQKQQSYLRSVKEQMRKDKQNERCLIRNNSLKYENMIKLNRKTQLQRKQSLIRSIKNQRIRHSEQLQKAKQDNKKQKQMEIYNNNVNSIDKLPTLQQKLDQLTKKKEEISGKVNQKQQKKMQMMMQYKKLKSLKGQELKELLKEMNLSPEMIENDKNQQFMMTKSLLSSLHQRERLSFADSPRHQSQV